MRQWNHLRGAAIDVFGADFCLVADEERGQLQQSQSQRVPANRAVRVYIKIMSSQPMHTQLSLADRPID